MRSKERTFWAVGAAVALVLVVLTFVFMRGPTEQPVVQDQTNDEMEVAPS
jgi:hypothetical protein